jgi:hypothetical protein
MAVPPALADAGVGTSCVIPKSKPGLTVTLAVAESLAETGSPTVVCPMLPPTVKVPLDTWEDILVTIDKVG